MAVKSFLAGRRLQLAFLLSLALNFFFIAVGAAIYLERPRGFPPSPEMMAERLAGKLSDEGSALFLEGFEKHREKVRSYHLAVKEAREQIRILAQADELDLQAIQVVREQMNENFANLMSSLDAFMMEIMTELSVEDRKQLIDSLPR